MPVYSSHVDFLVMHADPLLLTEQDESNCWQISKFRLWSVTTFLEQSNVQASVSTALTLFVQPTL
jgi:hypothetical protein